MDGDVTTLRMISAQFTGRDAIDAFRETYGRTVMQLDIEPLPGHPFDIDFTVRAFDGFGLAKGRLTPTINAHRSSMIVDDDVVLVCSPSGHGSIQQIGLEVVLRDGEATLAANGVSGMFYGHAVSELHNFRLSRAVLESMGVDVDSGLLNHIDAANPALRLLLRYASVVDDDETLSSAEVRRAVALHMHDLAAVVIGAGRDGLHLAHRRGVRAARLRAVKEDIVANLSLSGLSAAAVARRIGVTPRYINMLFEGEGVSFSEFVLSQRLVYARRMLLDPRMRTRPISEIAYEAGFGDLSYFNRTFRRRFGATPSDIRAQARQGR